MAKKQLIVKMPYQDELRKITATRVQKQSGRLVAFNGTEVVAEFPEDRLEYWSLEDVE